MQGVFDNYGARFKTKKALKENVLNAILEATSFFGNEYDGPVKEAPDGRYFVVGPDPYTKRSWYATITVVNGTPKVS